MATFKECVRCGKMLALHLFIGKKGVVCRECLDAENYNKWRENTRKKNNRWREQNPEKVKEQARKNYHNIRERFAEKSLKVQLLIKKESFEFNIFLKEKGIIGLGLMNQISNHDFIEINNQLISNNHDRIKELHKEYRERKGDALKEYKANWYQENKKAKTNITKYKKINQ